MRPGNHPQSGEGQLPVLGPRPRPPCMPCGQFPGLLLSWEDRKRTLGPGMGAFLRSQVRSSGLGSSPPQWHSRYCLRGSLKVPTPFTEILGLSPSRRGRAWSWELEGKSSAGNQDQTGNCPGNAVCPIHTYIIDVK